jgi:hypothetical protein
VCFEADQQAATDDAGRRVLRFVDDIAAVR